jgi:hypothetical protein
MIMPAFSAPLCIRLHGGLRGDPYSLPLTPLEDIFGIELKLGDDNDLGGVHYRYSPQPPPEFGPVTILVHPNEISDTEATYPERPDLGTVLRVDLFGATFLDPGRLEWSLRSAYGDLFDVCEYSAFSLPRSDAPGLPVKAHWVEFAAFPGHRSVPLADTPPLACTLDVEVPVHREDAARTGIAELTDSVAVLRRIDAAPAGEPSTRLRLRFDSPSLLELGRYAEAIAATAGNETRFIGYSVHGDLQRNGQYLHVEHAFSSNEHAQPTWRVAGRPR